MDPRVIFITCGSEQEALQIAQSLINEALAACINIIAGVTSVYTWQGKTCRETEWLLIVKTSQHRLPEVEKRVHELHSYSTPEFIVLEPEHISEKYKGWMSEVL